MKKKLMIISVAFVVSLCGCGKKKDVSSDFQSIDSHGEVTTATSGNKTKENASKDHLEYTLDVKGVAHKLVVNADVEADAINDFAVYDMIPVSITEEWLLEKAKSIFDNGEYEVKNVVPNCSMEQLQADLSHMDELIAESKQNSTGVSMRVSQGYDDLWSYIEYGDQQENPLEDGQVIVYTDIGSGMGYAARIWGKIDGEEYELSYIDSEYYKALTLNKLACFAAKTGYFMRNDSVIASTYGENRCNYEDAEEIAMDFISGLGLDDYDLAETFEISGSGEDGSIFLDGYRFEFTPCIDGIKTDYTIMTRTTKEYDPAQKMDDYIDQSVIQVDVDSSGLFMVQIGDIYQIGECVNENINVMPIEQVDALVQTAIKDQFEEYCEIHKVKLEYVTVKYEEGYVNVPAWVYFVKTSTSEIYARFACNALDGTMIYFNYNYATYKWQY